MVFEPVMFGLIGAEVLLDKLDASTIGLLLPFDQQSVVNFLYHDYFGCSL